MKRKLLTPAFAALIFSILLMPVENGLFLPFDPAYACG